MSGKTEYMLVMLVAVGIVSYVMRALPFLLFGTRKEPPAFVKYIGRVLCPAAIAMLVIYCYAGEVEHLAQGSSLWRMLAPYLAGMLTVMLQIWKRNSLISILAGTALYMVLVRL